MAAVAAEAAAPHARSRLAALAARFEPWLLLPAGPPLVLREVFPVWAQIGAVSWIAVLWLVRWAARGRPTVPTAIDVPALALLLTLPGAIWVASDLPAAWSRALSLFFAVALAYAMANAVHTPRRVWSAVGWLQVAALGLATVALVSVDWQEKFDVLSPLLGRLPRLVTAIPHPTLQDPAVHPNSVAALLLLVIPLSLACLSWPGREEEGRNAYVGVKPRWLLPVSALTFVAATSLLLLTQSRGAWLGLGVALGLLVALRSRPLAGVLLGAGATVVAAAAVLAPLVMGGSGALPIGPASGTVASRLELWRGSLELLSRAPETGIGLNTFALVYGQQPEYEGYYIYQGYAHAHNTLLQAALDFGIPGFVAVVALYVAVAVAAWRAHRRLAGTPLDAAVVGIAAGLAGHAVHGLSDALAIGAKPGFYVWAFVGTLVGIRYYAHRWANAPERHHASEREPDGEVESG